MQSFDDWGLMDQMHQATANEGADRLTLGPKVSFRTLNTGVPMHFSEKFDFVHVRYLSFAADHDTLFRNAYENLNPGGWAEFHEWLLVVQSSNGFSKGRGAVLKQWSDLCEEGMFVQCCVSLSSPPPFSPLFFLLLFNTLSPVDKEKTQT